MVRLEVPGVQIDVVELLCSLHGDELYAAVDEAFESRPEVRLQLVEAWGLNGKLDYDLGAAESLLEQELAAQAASLAVPVEMLMHRAGRPPAPPQPSQQDVAQRLSAQLTGLQMEPPEERNGDPRWRQGQAPPTSTQSWARPMLGSPQPFEGDAPMALRGSPRPADGDREIVRLGTDTRNTPVLQNREADVRRILASEQLMEAVSRADQPAVRQLVEAQADVNHTRSDGSCPAALATVQGRPSEILQLLLEQGVSADARAAHDLSLVHIWSTGCMRTRAQREEACAKLRLLVAYRADVDARVKLSGNAPLHLAAEEFQRARAQVESAGASGAVASKETIDELVGLRYQCQLLLQARANPSTKNLMGQTPLELIDQSFHRELWGIGTSAEAADDRQLAPPGNPPNGAA